MRKLLRAGCLALCAAIFTPILPPSAAAQEITLQEARALARAALARGEPQLALNIGKGLLQADPKDPDALLIVAAAQAQLGNPINGRRAAARAYRNSKDRREKLQAAQIAAGLALRAERPTLTQIWLRRASLQATNPADQNRIAADYRRVRNANPWNFNLDVSVRPSSNVNNGADTPFQVVDGLDDLQGQLSGSAQALSGLIAQGQLTLSYRLRGTDRSRTDLRWRLFVRRVDLSDEAREIDTVSENSDFGSTYTELSVAHGFKVGTRPGETARLTFGLGESWYGGDISFRFARAEAQRRWRLDDATLFTLTGSVMYRDVPDDASRNSTTLGLQTGITRNLENGGQLGVTLGVNDTQSDFENRANTAYTLRTRYKFPKAWGPARATAGLTLQSVDYPTYVVLNGITAPGGRQDTSAYADLTLFFPDYDYAGFAPEITLRAGRRTSNVSRFDTRELSITVGIQSKF